LKSSLVRELKLFVVGHGQKGNREKLYYILKFVICVIKYIVVGKRILLVLILPMALAQSIHRADHGWCQHQSEATLVDWAFLYESPRYLPPFGDPIFAIKKNQ
jgi:hypothetical protein